MKIKCSKCNKELKKFGANLYGPPEYLSRGHERDLRLMGYECMMVRKIHLCKDCYLKLLKWIFR